MAINPAFICFYGISMTQSLHTKRLQSAIWAALASLAMMPVSHAQSQSPASAPNNTVNTLDNIVITATGTEVDLRDAPASISVISREEIERKPVTSIAELLNTVPGVSGGYAATGAQSKIKIRGLPEAYTLILVDGKRQGSSAHTNYRPDLGQQDLDWISPEMIERIEVVRGPMSSLYGSDAMGGVINIITRKVSPVWAGTFTSNYSKPDNSDRGDTYQLGANVSGPLTESLGLRLGGNVTRRTADDVAGGASGTRNQNVNALLNWQITPDQSISADVAQGIQRATPSTQLAANGNPIVAAWGSSKLTHTSYGLTHDGRYGSVSSKVNLYHNKYENKGSSAASNSSETILDGKIDLPYTLFVDNLLSTGLQWKREELENSDTIGTVPVTWNGDASPGAKLDSNTWAVFGENQMFLRDDLTLTLGLRMDHHEKYGNHWSPRGYLVYHPTEAWTLKGGIARGFRAPNLKENSAGAATQSGGNGCRSLAGMGWTSSSTNADGTRGCYMAGNPNLEPETSTSYEFGAGYAANGWSVEATYFHTDFKNKIDYAPLGLINGYWWTRMENAQKARTRGLEASLRVPLLSTLEWRSNLTRMFESKNLSTGQDLLVVPKLTINSDLNWRITDRWTANLSAQYVGKQSVPSEIPRGGLTFAKAYTTFDLTTHYDVNQNLTLRAGVINLTNKSTLDSGNNYDSGNRTYFVGLTSRF